MKTKNVALVLSIIALAAFTIGLYVFFYSGKNVPVVNLTDYKNPNKITEFFDRNGINYSINEENQVLVDEKSIDNVRRSLALNGITSESGVGFELFSESDYGMTEFAQNVNYQRAVQGELERTIMSIESITSARVHVNIPKNKGLFKEKEASTASILLHIREDNNLSNYQIAGIKELVSAAINNIDGSNIKIIDQHGNILSGDSNTMHIKPRENELENKLVELLMINYEPANFKASVNIAFKRNDKEVTTETIAPDNKTFVESEELSSSSKNSSSGNASNQSKKKYRYSRRVETEVIKGDLIESISASVIFNQSLSESELTKIKTLVKSAIGYKESRGDAVEVIVLGNDFKKLEEVKTTTKSSGDITQPSATVDSNVKPERDVRNESGNVTDATKNNLNTEVSGANGEIEKKIPLSNDILLLVLIGIGILFFGLLAILLQNWLANRRALNTLREIRNA